MACPKCGSDDWKLASLVYREGLHHSSSQTTFSGVGVGTGGVGVGRGSGQTSGTQQSDLSRLAAPPTNPYPCQDDSDPAVVIGVFCAFIALGISFFASANTLGYLLAGLLGYFLPYAIASKYVRRDDSVGRLHAIQMEAWERKRMCQRCGHFYWLREENSVNSE